MQTTEYQVEDKIFEDEPRNLLTVKNMAIGAGALVLLVTGGTLFAYRGKIFGAKPNEVANREDTGTQKPGTVVEFPLGDPNTNDPKKGPKTKTEDPEKGPEIEDDEDEIKEPEIEDDEDEIKEPEINAEEVKDTNTEEVIPPNPAEGGPNSLTEGENVESIRELNPTQNNLKPNVVHKSTGRWRAVGRIITATKPEKEVESVPLLKLEIKAKNDNGNPKIHKYDSFKEYCTAYLEFFKHKQVTEPTYNQVFQKDADKRNFQITFKCKGRSEPLVKYVDTVGQVKQYISDNVFVIDGVKGCKMDYEAMFDKSKFDIPAVVDVDLNATTSTKPNDNEQPTAATEPTIHELAFIVKNGNETVKRSYENVESFAEAYWHAIKTNQNMSPSPRKVLKYDDVDKNKVKITLKKKGEENAEFSKTIQEIKGYLNNGKFKDDSRYKDHSFDYAATIDLSKFGLD